MPQDWTLKIFADEEAQLADPAFAPVGAWLEQRGVGVEEVQAQIDDFLGRVREAALASGG